MLTVKAIREEQQNLLDRVQAIVDLAKTESRELSAEETTEIDAINGAGDKPGKLDELQAKLDRALKIEANHARIVAARTAPKFSGDGVFQPHNEFSVPAKARAFGRLECFTGSRAAEDAYGVGMQFKAALFEDEKAIEFCRDHGLKSIKNVAHSDSNSAGAYLVPEIMESGIIMLREQYGTIRRDAGRQTMSSDVELVNTSLTDPTIYFANQTTATTESDVTFGQYQLSAKEASCLVRMSKILSEDALIGVIDQIGKSMAQAFAVKEDDCGFNGDGTATYGGMTGLKNALQAGSIVDAVSGNTAFSTLDLADFESVVGKLPEYAGINPKWYISKPGWAASMSRLQNAAGGQAGSDIAAGAQKMFLGYPVVFQQNLLTALTAQVSTICCYFGDLSKGLALGDRRGMTFEADGSRYFEYRQVGLLATSRFDVVCHKPGDGTNPGPILALKLAAS